MDLKLDQIKYGKYYTTKNVFLNNQVFNAFIDDFNLQNHPVLEPFAGANHLTNHLLAINANWKITTYDLWPNAAGVIQNDSIRNWIYGKVDLVITNPPYLAKNKATKLKLNWDYNDYPYDDLYKICLAKILNNCHYLIAIIPTTLIYSQRKCDQWLLSKLVKFQLINNNHNFVDANLLVAIAYFDGNKNDHQINFSLYQDQDFVNTYQNLVWRPQKLNQNIKVSFNDQNPNLVIKCIDGIRPDDQIRFLDCHEISRPIKNSDRQICQIRITGIKVDQNLITKLNQKLLWLRSNQYHYLWTTFKSLNQSKQIRRRISFKLIRQVIQAVLADQE